MSTNSAFLQSRSDFSDLLNILVEDKVRFLVVGGFAVMKYTEPRFTKDLDLWSDPTPANAATLFRALRRFGAPLRGVAPDYFAVPGNFYQIGAYATRVDILTSLSGDLPFDAAWERRQISGLFGAVAVPFISREDLIFLKRASGREEDMLDVKRLERIPRTPKDL